MKNLAQAVVLTIVSLASLQSSALADEAYIQTRVVSVQAEPKLLAKSKKKLTFGDAVTVISTEGGWVKVRTADRLEGYLHSSALSSRRVSLSGDKSAGSGVSDSDISLAGKGFSPEVEQQLASKNGSLNFRAVDAMERVSTSPEQVRAFIKSGNLNQELL